MPHSSGGGSHGGGFHGGSGFRGGRTGGGVNRSHISTRPFAGAHKYYYYDRNRIKYLYADGAYDNQTLKVSFIIAILAFLSIFAGIMLPFLSELNNEKIDSEFDVGIVIEDNANVLGDTDEIYEAFEAFYEETGIVPSLVTLNKSSWVDTYGSSFKKCAYDAYVYRFKDEYHWLIVYSVDDNNAENFVWEGMQGVNTDPVLTQGATEAFGKRLHRNFESSEYSVDEAVVEAFNYFTPRVLRGFIDSQSWGIVLFMLALFVFCIVGFVLAIVRTDKLKGAKLWQQGYREISCEDCGRACIVGVDRECRFCGAQVPRH